MLTVTHLQASYTTSLFGQNGEILPLVVGAAYRAQGAKELQSGAKCRSVTRDNLSSQGRRAEVRKLHCVVKKEQGMPQLWLAVDGSVGIN